jgi:hypothetical protein
MDLKSELAGRLIRVIAIVTLLLGLNDASRLLGVSLGSVSPITTLGLTGFIYLAIFTLARLFAAVGLWIKASWGAVLLVAATITELGLFFSGSPDVQVSVFGLIVRLALILSIVALGVLALRHRRATVHD